MQEHQRRFPLGIVVGLSTLVVATGSATAFFTWQNAQKNQTTPVAVEKSQPNSSQALPAAPPTASQNFIRPQAQAPTTEKTAQVFWLKDKATDMELVPTAIKVKSDNRQEALLTAAVNTLLNGSPNQDLMTGIPQGTQLRSLKVKSDSIYIDLTKPFTTGGGSLAMTGRLAQILYTATSLDPKAKVFLSVEGKPLTVLGGEGLIVEQPLTRSQFEQDTGAPQE